MKAILSVYELLDNAIGVDVHPVTGPQPIIARHQIVPTIDEILVWTRRDVDALAHGVRDLVMAVIRRVNIEIEEWMILKIQYQATNQTRI